MVVCDNSNCRIQFSHQTYYYKHQKNRKPLRVKEILPVAFCWKTACSTTIDIITQMGVIELYNTDGKSRITGMIFYREYHLRIDCHFINKHF